MDGSKTLAHDRDSARSALWCVLFLAGAVRTVAWWRTAALFDDGPLFIYSAQAMAAGNWAAVLDHPYHPLYSAGIWLLGSLVGDFETAAVGLSIACGVASVALLYGLLRDAFDVQTALIGATILAVHPRAVEFTSDVQSDSLYMVLFLAALFLLGKRLFGDPPRSALRSLGLAAATGFLIGASYLTRPEGLGLAVAGGAVGVAMVGSGRWRLAACVPWAAALAIALLLTMAPYVLALRSETGTWILSQKKSATDLMAFERSNGEQVPRKVVRPAEWRIPLPAALPRAGDSARPPDQAAFARWAEALHVTSDAVLSALRYDVLVLLCLGLWSCRGVPGPRAWLIGGVVALYIIVLLALAVNSGYVSRRHALTPLLPALGYAALGVPMLGRFIMAGWQRLAGTSAIGWFADGALASRPADSRQRWSAAVGLAVVVLLALPADLSPRRLDRLAVRQAAEWLRAREESPQVVAAGRQRIAYYAGGRFVPLPSAPRETMMRYLRRKGARYVIVDEAKLDRHVGLRDARAEGLRLIHRETAEGRSAAVFEVMPAG